MPQSKDHFQGRHYVADRLAGPVRSLNPTVRIMSMIDRRVALREDGRRDAPPHPGVAHVWRSRDNRKGRHAIVVAPDYQKDGGRRGARPTNTLRETLRGLGKMATRYPVWDVSYDTAMAFTFGSAVWVMNGFFSWQPLVDPWTKFPGEVTWAGGLTALIGATIFEFGSVLLMLEALNENTSDCFGWAFETTLDGLLTLEHEEHCVHSHMYRRAFLTASDNKSEEDGGGGGGSNEPNNYRTWSWWPTWYEFRTHYIHEIGFLACFAQFWGATIFWIAGITALPPIQKRLTPAALNGIYWLPQVVGGSGFIISSWLFMVEVQPNWYTMAPRVLGWHMGVWNLVGAVGFTLCGALGFDASNSAVNYAAALSTFIGSWAFLIGSVVQWYESLDKYPIWVDDSLPTRWDQEKGTRSS